MTKVGRKIHKKTPPWLSSYLFGFSDWDLLSMSHNKAFYRLGRQDLYYHLVNICAIFMPFLCHLYAMVPCHVCQHWTVRAFSNLHVLLLQKIHSHEDRLISPMAHLDKIEPLDFEVKIMLLTLYLEHYLNSRSQGSGFLLIISWNLLIFFYNVNIVSI